MKTPKKKGLDATPKKIKAQVDRRLELEKKIKADLESKDITRFRFENHPKGEAQLEHLALLFAGSILIAMAATGFIAILTKNREDWRVIWPLLAAAVWKLLEYSMKPPLK